MALPALTLPETTWLQRLSSQHDAQIPELELLDAYYEGEQPLSYMHPELLRRLDGRVRQVVVNWPELIADSLDERLDVTGFRLGGRDAADRDLWRIWKANRLDLASQQAHIDALVMGRAFAIVGTNEADGSTPLVTVESPLEVHAEIDPRTRKVRAALKRWYDDEAAPGTSSQVATHATLYLPNETIWYTSQDGGAAWVEDRRDAHGMGEVPVVPLINRPRTRRRRTKPATLGRSELASVIPLSDAACKIATDMMVSAEFHAMPRRYALGFEQSDFVDAQGKPLTPWQAVAGVLWASPKSPKDDGVAVGQFPEADLSNFHNTLNALARLTSSLSGLPPHFLGYSTENPASADGIRSSEGRHIKRAERRQRSFGDGWEQVMRLVLLVRDGRIPPEALRMECQWIDAATPTFAAQADAVTKLYAADKLLPRRASRRALGYSDAQIRDMEAEDQQAYARVVGGDQAAEYGPKPDPQPESDEDQAQAQSQADEPAARVPAPGRPQAPVFLAAGGAR
ncbi:phage portal protein [Actinokineospora iranica]|uniref:Phage portal protein, SPP1 Gp6-like n=1 Tax=Actinokineospora iranica TaxID=1271860 RepID=A0A1G6K3T6_9PSEU|nr:phage portal protein [Actinokineospora iranica]SDC25603.1 Phage portal protein, SPP1 Gp6-like [Actinokineospora iranica]